MSLAQWSIIRVCVPRWWRLYEMRGQRGTQLFLFGTAIGFPALAAMIAIDDDKHDPFSCRSPGLKTNPLHDPCR